MKVRVNAYAKINLFLDVTDRREDGFHNILSVMQSISLCDTLQIDAKESNKLEIVLTCNDPSLPLDENNLIYKSALKYLSFYNINAKVEIILEKRIPIGAGLGGGSSDAAATLRGLNQIYGLASEEELLQLGAEIGSDVPFCIVGGRALCTGRGEKIQRLVDYPQYCIVVAIGNERISTPKAYAALDHRYNYFDGKTYVPREFNGQFYNIFESVTDITDLSKIKEIMIKSGAESAMMSGSGPAVFGIFSDEAAAWFAADNLNFEGFSAYYCQTVKGEL